MLDGRWSEWSVESADAELGPPLRVPPYLAVKAAGISSLTRASHAKLDSPQALPDTPRFAALHVAGCPYWWHWHHAADTQPRAAAVPAPVACCAMGSAGRRKPSRNADQYRAARIHAQRNGPRPRQRDGTGR